MKSKTVFIIDKYAKDDGPAFFIKVLVGLMVLLTVVMLAYYAFIHHDETLQTAGMAVDSPINNPDEDTYGYEITEQDMRNVAQPVAPEYETPVGNEVPEVIDNQEVPIRPDIVDDDSRQTEIATGRNDEPQLME